MQNMKLLYLETSKYLVLGKDWLYGRDWIVLMSFMPLYNRVEDAWFIEGNEGTNITNARYLISEPPEPLKPLCERVGAVVYGGRYVLNPQKANVIKVDQQGSRTRYTYGLGSSSFPFEIVGNLFEEYSKQLRNEPNKFEELMELLK